MKEEPICSTSYMSSTLSHFNKSLVEQWFENIDRINTILEPYIQEHLATIENNENRITTELIEIFSKILKEERIDFDPSIVEHIEAFHGYTVYPYCDNKKILKELGDNDVYYGLAKATTYGIVHTHELSDAYNYVVDGEGVFTGDLDDKGKYPFYYHGLKLEKGVELEVPKGMAHGHLAKKGSHIWFFFVQQCGFRPGLKCVGDFYPLEQYDVKQFGDGYI